MFHRPVVLLHAIIAQRDKTTRTAPLLLPPHSLVRSTSYYYHQQLPLILLEISGLTTGFMNIQARQEHASIAQQGAFHS